MIKTLKQYVRRNFFAPAIHDKEVVDAYDIWAENYDAQPGNLMLDLDEQLFLELIDSNLIKNKQVADIGCGTGRHWAKIFKGAPSELTGFDVSPGMLNKLTIKFPAAKTYTITNNHFPEIDNDTYDTIISTLTVAHIENIEEALEAWSRILKPAGDIIITDFHPDALAAGGKRTFRHEKIHIAVHNFVHTIEKIQNILETNGFELIKEIEKPVNETVRHYYSDQNALHVYEKFKGMPIIYGIHFQEGKMILKNLKMLNHDQPVDIHVSEEKIADISPSSDIGNVNSLNLDEALVFPGLINSHDHLDFNLFPQLGDRIYNNYTEWGKYLHENYKQEIADIIKIPGGLRTQWGIYKNLLCGITTVVNHGEKLGTRNNLITVFNKTHCIHSVQFEKNWKTKLNNPFKLRLPVSIHIGEGSDHIARNEIDQLIRWNLFRKKLIGIHAVAMIESQAKKFKAVVWCPQSNYFLLGKTAPVNVLQKHTNLLFGTDSTLTGTWDIWDHLRSARNADLISDDALCKTLNNNAAKTWKLNSGEIAPGKDADLVIAKTKQNINQVDAFFKITPADILLVIHKGNIQLFDNTLLSRLKTVDLTGYSKIYINNACKYVKGDLPGLIQKIRKFNPAIKFPISTTKPVFA